MTRKRLVDADVEHPDNREPTTPHPYVQKREIHSSAVRIANTAQIKPPRHSLTETSVVSRPRRQNCRPARYNDNAEGVLPTSSIGRGGIGHKSHVTNPSAVQSESTEREELLVHERDFTADRIIVHGTNADGDHPTTSVGKTTYRVRWKVYLPIDAPFEPARHLPRNKLVSYYNRNGLPLPSEVSTARAGQLY